MLIIAAGSAVIGSVQAGQCAFENNGVPQQVFAQPEVVAQPVAPKPVEQPVMAQPVVAKPVEKTVVIAIDGPYASGKSTIAKLVADKLGYQYINSGALYRAVLHVLKNKLAYTQAQLDNLQASDVKAVLDSNKLSFNNKDGQIDVLYDNVSITPLLRTAEIDAIVHKLGKNEAIRQALSDYMQQFVTGKGLVAESYGIGKTFPNADVKVYLTASQEERLRRMQEKKALQDEPIVDDQLKAKLMQVDDRGEGKDVSQRSLPADAHTIDTTKLSKEEVANAIIAKLKK